MRLLQDKLWGLIITWSVLSTQRLCSYYFSPSRTSEKSKNLLKQITDKVESKTSEQKSLKLSMLKSQTQYHNPSLLLFLGSLSCSKGIVYYSVGEKNLDYRSKFKSQLWHFAPVRSWAADLLLLKKAVSLSKKMGLITFR